MHVREAVTGTVGDTVSDVTGPAAPPNDQSPTTPPPSAPASDTPATILDDVSGAVDQAGQAIDTPNTDVPELGTAPTGPSEGNATTPPSPVTDTLDSTGDGPLAPVTDCSRRRRRVTTRSGPLAPVTDLATPVTDVFAPPAAGNDSGNGPLAPVTDLLTPVTDVVNPPSDNAGNGPLAPVTDLLTLPTSGDGSGGGPLAPVTDLLTPVTDVVNPPSDNAGNGRLRPGDESADAPDLRRWFRRRTARPRDGSP